ncbi:hypothetical protein DENIS_0929 [Desulfonema ishimotonii]|uniref:Orc1-like AAA ATPase domain-containing protein n=1 Tax=Desulfonema ishimotonii TaxID=45657 RepID=A0A401FSP6_9BACT|nr:ATP-binding protein [Desulfonema ishimotonii]GBC59987.1 hypothetical protein DENIS_0929 [Desulfonema ishimotonii]
MTENQRKLEILKTENPFISSSVGDPREEKYPDISTVNAAASEGIFHLIRQKHQRPALPFAGLIFGETGSGKTHLISRILKHSREQGIAFSFAYIQPIEAPEQTYRYLLREIVVNLCHPVRKSSRTTQLDIILEKLFEDIGYVPSAEPTCAAPPEAFADDFKTCLRGLFKKRKISRSLFRDLGTLFAIFVNIVFSDDQHTDAASGPGENGMDILRTRFPDIPKAFFKVLFQYQNPEKRAAAVEWLKGTTLDETDALLLSVPDRQEISVPMREHQARSILDAIGRLLAHYNMPLLICFDRLENYDTEAKIRALGVMIEFLVDQSRAMLPLVFVRGAQWEEKFRSKLNQQALTRLETNAFTLRGCRADQSLDIIRRRLESVLGDMGEDLFPFDRDDLTQVFRSGLHSPRQVIMRANRKLREILYPEKSPAQPPSSLSRLRDEFTTLTQTIRTDFDRYPPDRDRLRRALKLCLTHRPAESGVAIEEIDSPEDKFIDFRCACKSGAGDAFEALFILDVEQNSPSVRASLKRGIDFLEKEPDGRVIYIRDARCEIPEPPQWKATNEMLRQFRESSGHVLFLDEAQAARWYALALLSYAVKEGDVVAEDHDQVRPVTLEEMGNFVRDEIHTRAFSGFRHIDGILTAEGIS